MATIRSLEEAGRRRPAILDAIVRHTPKQLAPKARCPGEPAGWVQDLSGTASEFSYKLQVNGNEAGHLQSVVLRTSSADAAARQAGGPYLEVAVSMRSLKRWVVVPKGDARGFLVSEITDRLQSILSGDWDALRRSAPEVISVRERARGLRARAVLLAVVAVAPLIVVVIFYSQNAKSPASIAPALAIGDGTSIGPRFHRVCATYTV